MQIGKEENGKVEGEEKEKQENEEKKCETKLPVKKKVYRKGKQQKNIIAKKKRLTTSEGKERNRNRNTIKGKDGTKIARHAGEKTRKWAVNRNECGKSKMEARRGRKRQENKGTT